MMVYMEKIAPPERYLVLVSPHMNGSSNEP